MKKNTIKRDVVVLSTKAFAELFGVHRATVVKMCQNKKLDAKQVKIGNRKQWFITIGRDIVEVQSLENAAQERAKNVEKIRKEIDNYTFEKESTTLTSTISWAIVCIVAVIVILWIS